MIPGYEKTRLQLTLQVRHFLQKRVGDCDRARGSLERSLRGDHLYELCGEIHCREFEGAGQHRAKAAVPRRAGQGLA